MEASASNYFAGQGESSSANDLHGSKPWRLLLRTILRPIATIFNAYVADATPATAVESPSAASPSLPADWTDDDDGSYLLHLLGFVPSSEGQVTDNVETNQKPMGHKESDVHHEQFVSDLHHDTQEISSVESGSEIHNVDVELRNDSFKNPNGSSNIHHNNYFFWSEDYNSWSTEDWNIHIRFNDKYTHMPVPPQVASRLQINIL